MTDRDALLRAILHDPDDDIPRLVYADHLDECEPREAERAEFVRLMVRTADWAAGRVSPGPSAEEAISIWNRWYDLMEDAHRWLPESVRNAGRGFMIRHSRQAWTEDASLPMRVHFARGFVDAVECDLAPFLAHASALFAAHPVTRVVITDAVIHPSGGNDTYYVGGLGVFPSEYWRRLENHRTRSGALSALSAVCVAYGRQLADLPGASVPAAR